LILKRSPKKTFTKKQKVLSLNKEVSQTAKDTTKRTFEMFAGNKNTYISLNTPSIIVDGKNGTKNFFKILENGNVEVTCSAIVPQLFQLVKARLKLNLKTKESKE